MRRSALAAQAFVRMMENGGGPIPVSLAKELGRDAFLKGVLHDGTELHTIAHFNGNVCAAPGCDRRYHHLQRDHIDPVANGGLTSYVNNQLLCSPDHRSLSFPRTATSPTDL